MAKKPPTWTTRGVTHQRLAGGAPRTLCGLTVPYRGPGHVKLKQKRLAKDRKPKPVTCIDCLADHGQEPMRILLNDGIRGLSADMVYLDEAGFFK